MSIRKFASFVGVVFVGVILILVVAIGGAKMFLNGGGARAEGVGPSEHMIKMAGTAEVKVKPDIVKINLRLEALERTVKKAREVSSQKYEKLATQMKSDFQIKDVDLEILNNSITEEWNYDYDEKQSFIEYRATKSFCVTFTDFKKADLFYETAADDFGCRIDSVEYDSTKLREFKDLARKNAVIAAKEKAQSMVQAIGQNIGKAITIEENVASNDYWYGSSPASNISVNSSTSVNNNAKPDSSLPKSLNSNLDVSYSVMVTFALE